MKFFWKLFFTTMFISFSCIVLTGYILIQSNFNSLLDNEINAAYETGDIVYYSLANELNNTKNSGFYPFNEKSKTKKLKNMANSIQIMHADGVFRFSIFDSNEQSLFSSLGEHNFKRILDAITETQRGYEISHHKDGIYIETIRPATFYGDLYYIGTSANIDYIFSNQQSQYQMMLHILLIMFLLVGTTTFLISKLLMRTVTSIKKTSVEIAHGNLNNRVPVTGSDEFSILAENFNKMADSLEEKIDELKDEGERKELFVGAFSHELKTPLTSIIGYADMLRSKANDIQRVKICANYIFTEGRRLERMSMRLLDFMVLKNQELSPVETDIDAFITSIFPIFHQKLQDKKIKLLYCIEPAMIWIEPELMKTVFINLIDNAQKAIDQNGIIQIIGKKSDTAYEVLIEDNGRGMEPDEISRIREAFYMVDKSRARKQGGSGLGLALCDLILAKHGFDISIKSKVDVGTKVTVIMKGATQT